MLRLVLVVLWPSFLAAIVAEGLFFSFFDPHELAIRGDHPEWSPLAIYTSGFFFFWVFCSLASALTCYLAVPPTQRVSKQ